MTIQKPLKVSPLVRSVWTAYGPLGQSKQYAYKAPDGTLWNIDRVEGNMVHLWTVNAWGSVHHQSVDYYRFKSEWRETV